MKFHPRMTVLSGLGAPEREALAESILGALTGGAEADGPALRRRHRSPRARPRAGPGGSVQARHDDDGSAAQSPVGAPRRLAGDLRTLMLVQAADLGVVTRSRASRRAAGSCARPAPRSRRSPSSSRPPSARSRRAADAAAELDELDEQLRPPTTAPPAASTPRSWRSSSASEPRPRPCSRAPAGVDADRHLLAHADATPSAGRALDRSRRRPDARASSASAAPSASTPPTCHGAAALPEASPPEPASRSSTRSPTPSADRDALDHRLQVLAVAKLPGALRPGGRRAGPARPGDRCGATADRLLAAADEVQRSRCRSAASAATRAVPTRSSIDRDGDRAP